MAPGTGQGLWYLDRCYGCPLSDAESSDEEESSAHILPAFMHEYEGITAEYIYTGEVFTIAHGGFNTNAGTRYRGNLDLVLTGDTEAMDLWQGGRIFMYGNAYHGQTLTNNFVGDTQFYSNIDSSPRAANEFLLMEFWYEHAFADGDIIVKVGKQDANADFAYAELGGDFVNSSFGFAPSIPMPTWPNVGLGAAVFLNLTDELHFKTGIYDGATSVGPPIGGRSGFRTLGDSGAMSLAEFSFTPQFGKDRDLPGTYKLGAWYHSADFDNLETGFGTLSGAWGYWAGADQMLWKEPGSDDEPQGLGVFMQYGWAPADRSAVNDYYGAGFTYRGAIKSRDTDIVGLGIASVGFSAAETRREDAIELFYKTQITPCVTVQPDVVYIAGPSGVGHDALLIGLRSEIVF